MENTQNTVIENQQETTSSKKVQFIKKLICYVGGMFLIAVGIIVSKRAGLGISPVSAVPYACELIWKIDLGVASAIVYMTLILLQIVILRKAFKPVQFLQFVCTYILSFFISIVGKGMTWLPDPSNYVVAMIYCLISTVIIGIGVAFYLMPKWIPLPAEGLAVAISQVSNGKLPFHNAKIIVDVSLVTLSAIMSVLFLGGLITVREGTVIAAILVGKVVGVVMKHFKEKTVAWMNH